MKLILYPEICCEICNEVIHNHMDCPCCKIKYAGTSAYIDIGYMDNGEILKCEECNAEFKLIKNDGYVSEYEWELITP